MAYTFQPPLHPSDPSAIVSIGFTPWLMTDFLVGLVRSHFAAPDRIEDPVLRDCVWAARPGSPALTDPASPILIDSAARWDPKQAEQRPAVLVREHDWIPRRIGINDEAMGRWPGGDRVFGNLLVGSHTLFCLGGTGDEAAHLGWEVFSDLMSFAPVIRESSPHLTRFAVAQLGGHFIVEEARQHTACPVTVAYQVQKIWRVHAHLPPIERLFWDVKTELAAPQYP